MQSTTFLRHAPRNCADRDLRGSHSRRPLSAFTLIELLATIAIIATLVALFVPFYGSMQSRAARVQCMSNLKQLSSAWNAYVADHNGMPPKDGRATGNNNPASWRSGPTLILFGNLFPYLGVSEGIDHTPEILLCDGVPYEIKRKKLDPDERQTTGRYWMNPKASTNADNRNRAVMKNANTVIISDVFYWWKPGLWGNENHEGDGMNVLFYDGSVTWVPAEKLTDVGAWDWYKLSRVASGEDFE